MKIKFFLSIVMVLLFSFLPVQAVFAASGTIIPSTESTDCDTTMTELENEYLKGEEAFQTKLESLNGDAIACAIKTGRIHMYLVPYFITYAAEFGLGIAGTISMLFLVIGGFEYMTGPLTQNKEQGKKTITYSLIGLVLSLSAWILVNIIQIFLTS